MIPLVLSQVKQSEIHDLITKLDSLWEYPEQSLVLKNQEIAMLHDGLEGAMGELSNAEQVRLC